MYLLVLTIYPKILKSKEASYMRENANINCKATLKLQGFTILKYKYRTSVIVQYVSKYSKKGEESIKTNKRRVVQTCILYHCLEVAVSFLLLPTSNFNLVYLLPLQDDVMHKKRFSYKLLQFIFWHYVQKLPVIINKCKFTQHVILV